MKHVTVLLLVAVICNGCRKTPDFDQLSSDFIVATSLDKEADFTSYQTFYIADTIRYIGGVGNDSILVGADAEKLVKAVKDNMIARGYTYTGRNNKPDLGLTLTAVKDIDVDVVWYPGWWWGYWPPCYWYYWCYPYYYPWSTTYVYATGTVILNMDDLKNADSRKLIRAVWNVTGLGAIGTSLSTNLQLGINAINQGFEQSPYVKAN
jgi:hypothetical protein